MAKDLINSSRYGLSASIFTNNPLSHEYFINNLKVGQVDFNQCFLEEEIDMPVTGRKLNQKIFYGSPYSFRNFYRFKSVSIRSN